jgi:hypothetical protein
LLSLMPRNRRNYIKPKFQTRLYQSR